MKATLVNPVEEKLEAKSTQEILEGIIGRKPPLVLLRRIGEMIAKELDSYLQKTCGITLSQFATLAILYHAMGRGEKVPLSELAENLTVTRGNVTGLIDRLRAQKYVRRIRDRNDRRRILVSITPVGAAKFESSIPHHKKFMQSVIGAILTHEERTQLHRLLRKIDEKLPTVLKEVKNKLETEEV